VTLQASLVDYPQVAPAQVAFKVIINMPNRPPKFGTVLPASIVILKTETPDAWSWPLPAILDDDGDEVTVSTDFGFASSFVSYIDGSLVVSDTSVVNAGFATAKITLSDGEAKKSYTTMLFIYDELTKPAVPEASAGETEEAQEA